MLKKEGAINTINEGLRDLYASQGHIDLKTLPQWNSVGKKVRKGEHALLLWGKPQKTMPKPELQPDTDKDVDEMNFFPLCFVFSNLQIQEAQ
ncbi:hypothetical protein SAMD00024442_6_32 [Candidatus Symbiothrix dinenymphae]|nr:hypothetical protein SAMD00024442_6_32 [Candidatus Symbiothrix dinenymphae]